MQDNIGKKKIAILLGLYTVCFSLLAIERHGRGNSGVFDLGIFDQALFLISRGENLFLTSRGLHIYADHFHPILSLLAPAYWIYPSVGVLLFLQTLLVGTGAYPAYLLGKRHGLSERWSLVMSAAYLAHPTIGFLINFDFHPAALIAPALMFAILFLEQGRPKAYTVALIAALSCTEAAGFTVIALAFTAFWIRDRWWFVGTFTLGASGIVLSKAWLSYFNQGVGTPYSMLYTRYGKGMLEVSLHLLGHPLETLAGLCTPLNLEYLFYLLISLLFLPLLAPERLVPAVPVLLGNLLSWRLSQHHVEYHYGAALAPFLIWAALVGWERAGKRGVPRELVGKLLIVASILALYFGPLGKRFRKPQPIVDLANVKAQVREDETVVASNRIGSHFSQRKNFYTFPNPFLVSAWGNRPKALVQQTVAEHRPMSRGAVRRGIESADFDCIILPRETERHYLFPLKSDERVMIREELLRSRLLEIVAPVEGDAFLLRKRSQQ